MYRRMCPWATDAKEDIIAWLTDPIGFAFCRGRSFNERSAVMEMKVGYEDKRDLRRCRKGVAVGTGLQHQRNYR